MSLSLVLDPNFRQFLEPGYRREFSAAGLATDSQANALAEVVNHEVANPARFLWPVPGTGTVQLKPMQLQPDFLNHQAQLDTNCVLRLSPLVFPVEDLLINNTDRTGKRIFEMNIGSESNPWIGHFPVTNLPNITQSIIGISAQLPHDLQSIADQSEVGSTEAYGDTANLPLPVPNSLKAITATFGREKQNQGNLFRWYQQFLLGLHQTIYVFVFAQYAAVCRGALLEVYEDTSPCGDRTAWTFRARQSIFQPGSTFDENPLNPTPPLGTNRSADDLGHYASLMVLPVGRQKVLFLAHTGQFILINVRAHPRRTLDGQEWDILRSDSIEVWGLCPTMGNFQIQRVKYPAPPTTPVTLFLSNIVMDYTPLVTPTVTIHGDADAGSQLIQGGLTSPKNYTFLKGPLDDDCPPPLNLATGLGRTFGQRIRFVASPDQRVSPQLYAVEVIAPPVFMDNPSPFKALGDETAAGSAAVVHAEMSLGINPGDGRLTCHVVDIPAPNPPHALFIPEYHFRSEVPIQLQQSPDMLFSGYTDRIEVQPWRGDPTAPVEVRFRCNDRWHLLETTILREQRDWQTIGHISVVDNILRQCGIDTGDLHPDGSIDEAGQPVFSGGSRAEYPAGWDGTLSSSYNTPLGTPIQNIDNMEGNKLLGWKPQPHDTGASFLRRITDIYSNWLLGFRADGTPYYLPYNYFQSSSVTFHPHNGWHVDSGLTPDPAMSTGLFPFVHGGTATINGKSVTVGDFSLLNPVTDNTTSNIYLATDGSGATAAPAGMAPPATLNLGSVTAAGGNIISADTTPASGRQLSSSPIFRRPLEYRTIEPSGNFIQVVSHFQLDQTANRSGLFVDWASFKNPKVTNYLGRPKWFLYEAGGAFSCSQLNRIAFIVAQAARRRRVRVSFDATYVPTLKIGQIVTLEGIGNFRMLELRATQVRATWQVANYVGELVEKGYGLPPA